MALNFHVNCKYIPEFTPEEILTYVRHNGAMESRNHFLILVNALTCLARRSGTVLSSSVMHAMMASAFLILFSRRNMSSSLTLPAMPGKCVHVLVCMYVCNVCVSSLCILQM